LKRFFKRIVTKYISKLPLIRVFFNASHLSLSSLLLLRRRSCYKLQLRRTWNKKRLYGSGLLVGIFGNHKYYIYATASNVVELPTQDSCTTKIISRTRRANRN